MANNYSKKYRKEFNQHFFKISNRRYLGSKEKLLPFISQVVQKHTKDVESVADIFAGTGVVADLFAKQDKYVIINDILHSNYIIYNTFFGQQNFSITKIISALDTLNRFNHYQKNYLAIELGGKYFTKMNASLIDQARQWLDTNREKFNQREFDIILTSILYATDKVANTVGFYDAYRKKMTATQRIYFKLPKFRSYTNAEIHMEDANQLVRHINPDLVYIDTPYNSRQYVTGYHVLENITDWRKPRLYGKARKSKNLKNRRSQYNLKSAPQAFDDLIRHIKARYILVSFNNTAHKGSERSSSKISNQEIINSLKKRGHVYIYSRPYRQFNAGKTSQKEKNQHKELLYLVKVTSNDWQGVK